MTTYYAKLAACSSGERKLISKDDKELDRIRRQNFLSRYLDPYAERKLILYIHYIYIKT